MPQDARTSALGSIGPGQLAPTALVPYGRRRVVEFVLVNLVLVQPAVAQSSAVCGAEKLPGMIEGFFQLSIGIGLLGLAAVWQADSLLEISPSMSRTSGI